MKTKEKVSEDLKEKLRNEFIRWIIDEYGHGGNSGTDEQDNSVADWWLSKLDSYTAKGLGRRGGLKRWKNVSKKKRSELGRELVLKRWKKLKEL